MAKNYMLKSNIYRFMQLQCEFKKYILHFKFDAGTSRGILREKETFFVKIYDPKDPDFFGIGECGPLKGLSPDDRADLEDQLSVTCTHVINSVFPQHEDEVKVWLNKQIGAEWPAIRFGLETAALDFIHGGSRKIVDNLWSESPYQGIPVNGLVWMGDKNFMLKQIDEKLKAGFNCIKMKIGAIDFETERSLLSYIRRRYDEKTITLRADANGAFTVEEALGKLEALSELGIHSIEQPIKPGQPEHMYSLCRKTPVPIALDEELIGIYNPEDKYSLLQDIQPQYIILKPTLLGGLSATTEWITVAQEHNIGWWITSALESNIGLNAIAQYTASLQVSMPQGLGTGQLYHNNITSPLCIEKGLLKYNPQVRWDLDMINNI